MALIHNLWRVYYYYQFVYKLLDTTTKQFAAVDQDGCIVPNQSKSAWQKSGENSAWRHADKNVDQRFNDAVSHEKPARSTSACGKTVEYPQEQMCKTRELANSRILIQDPLCPKTRFVSVENRDVNH